MEDQNPKSVRKKEIGTIVIMILTPLFVFLLFYLIVGIYFPSKITKLFDVSLLIGFGCGLLLDITFIITGLFSGTFMVVINRVKNFFSDLSISLKFAIEGYFYDIKTEGMTFWIYILIIAVEIILFSIGLSNAVEFYMNL